MFSVFTNLPLFVYLQYFYSFSFFKQPVLAAAPDNIFHMLFNTFLFYMKTFYEISYHYTNSTRSCFFMIPTSDTILFIYDSLFDVVLCFYNTTLLFLLNLFIYSFFLTLPVLAAAPDSIPIIATPNVSCFQTFPLFTSCNNTFYLYSINVPSIYSIRFPHILLPIGYCFLCSIYFT